MIFIVAYNHIQVKFSLFGIPTICLVLLPGQQLLFTLADLVKWLQLGASGLNVIFSSAKLMSRFLASNGTKKLTHTMWLLIASSSTYSQCKILKMVAGKLVKGKVGTVIVHDGRYGFVVLLKSSIDKAHVCFKHSTLQPVNWKCKVWVLIGSFFEKHLGSLTFSLALLEGNVTNKTCSEVCFRVAQRLAVKICFSPPLWSILPLCSKSLQNKSPWPGIVMSKAPVRPCTDA